MRESDRELQRKMPRPQLSMNPLWRDQRNPKKRGEPYQPRGGEQTFTTYPPLRTHTQKPPQATAQAKKTLGRFPVKRGKRKRPKVDDKLYSPYRKLERSLACSDRPVLLPLPPTNGMELNDIHSTRNLVSSIERKIERIARFPMPKLNGQVPSQKSTPCMRSLCKRYNVTINCTKMMQRVKSMKLM